MSLLLLDLPKATVASELWVMSLLISACSVSSVRTSKPLSMGCPVPPWWVAIACVFYVGTVSLISIPNFS